MASIETLAKDWTAANRRFIAQDPASPSCNSAAALEAMDAQRRAFMRMAEKTGFDTNAVRDAINAARCERLQAIDSRGYYTKDDVKAFRQEFGI